MREYKEREDGRDKFNTRNGVEAYRDAGQGGAGQQGWDGLAFLIAH
jgi:hypothetical protein